jgi:sugar phosphate isomerase/epimerase
MKLVRKNIIVLTLAINCITASLYGQQLEDYSLFVFNNGVQDEKYDTPEKQALLLKSLDYHGMEKKGVEGLSETLQALDKHGLELFTMYLNINLDNPEQPYDKGLREVFKMLEGRPTMPWFYVTSKKYKPSSEENDAIAVPILQEVADMANEYRIKVMIYPHVNFWIDNVGDAVRVAGKVNRRNFGITFNLCHFLADQGTKADAAFIPMVEKAMPYLFAISLNGADKPTEAIMQSSNPWQHFIQPLGKGTYDTYGYLTTFIQRGFKGPIGLQCYNIAEEKAVHLKASMAAWISLRKKGIEKIKR